MKIRVIRSGDKTYRIVGRGDVDRYVRRGYEVDAVSSEGVWLIAPDKVLQAKTRT